MPQSDYSQSITLKRESRTGDGAGGKVVTLNTVSTFVARKHFYRERSMLDRRETGPGVRTENDTLFVVDVTPFPDVRINDVLVTADSKQYTVLHVRSYAKSFQIDTRIIQ